MTEGDIARPNGGQAAIGLPQEERAISVDSADLPGLLFPVEVGHRHGLVTPDEATRPRFVGQTALLQVVITLLHARQKVGQNGETVNGLPGKLGDAGRLLRLGGELVAGEVDVDAHANDDPRQPVGGRGKAVFGQDAAEFLPRRGHQVIRPFEVERHRRNRFDGFDKGEGAQHGQPLRLRGLHKFVRTKEQRHQQAAVGRRVPASLQATAPGGLLFGQVERTFRRARVGKLLERVIGGADLRGQDEMLTEGACGQILLNGCSIEWGWYHTIESRWVNESKKDTKLCPFLGWLVGLAFDFDGFFVTIILLNLIIFWHR